MTTKYFPLVMIFLSVCAAVVCTLNRDWRHVIYWLASATIIASVTF